ncbi:DUF6093 family protein [Actinomadura bangladeshensis]|uniref:Uncharacterized protein n=1 Tax=Actinomadura bangladeshensis TaxID=453573 RepID=A0A6L9QAS3_9ACTN|nr:DUF6093 family protein [Actinomadura bangladeshensis]NEA22580.1 hypothetical protein [Actinomadura bangladeshensis]
MPLSTTTVFPPGWSQHHRPVASATMTGECTITRGATQLYDGACRVIADRSDVRNSIGDQQILAVRYLITVRYDTNDVQVGDVVTVTVAVDGGLVGRTFVVKEIRYGTQQWERDLYCEIQGAALPVLSDEITIVRAPLVTRYGNSLTWDWLNATRTTVAAGLQPGTSTEETGARDKVTTFYTAFVPAGTDVKVTDRVEWDDRVWEIDGEPRAWPQPETGTGHHIEVRLRNDEGG